MTIPAACQSDADLQARVMAVLLEHVGRAKAIGRAALVRAVCGDVDEGDALGVADRRVRDAISQLRRSRGAGALICSDKHGAGYWIAAEMAEIDEHLAPEKRRLASLSESIRSQEQNAARAFAEFERRRVTQMEMFG